MPVNTQKLTAIQDSTYKEMVDLLKTYGRCNIVRPTGFGKTRLFMRYCSDHPSDKFLYVYDTKAVKNNLIAQYKPANVKFISYYMLSVKANADNLYKKIMNDGYHTLIFDESHLMGGQNIAALLDRIIPNFTGQILGGTATDIRTDMLNVTSRFFDNHEPSEYDLADAIEDGIIVDPFYSAMVQSQQMMKQLKTKAGSNLCIQKRISQLEAAYAELLGADNAYVYAVQQVYGNTPSYMRFIAFYPTIKSLDDTSGILVDDFKKAFPNHTVRLTKISSKNEHETDISWIDSPDMTIDIIVCVNMLNQGYHSDLLTGIILLRATMSNILFTQQLGRCLSVNNPSRAIIFDCVSNSTLDPTQALTQIEQLQKLNSSRKQKRGSIIDKLKIITNPKELQLAEWYNRIRSTIAITQDKLDEAVKIYLRDKAPVWYIEKTFGIPRWMLKDELGDQWDGD